MDPDAKTRRPSWLGRILIAIGISGAAFAALCCFAPFLVAGLVTAIGRTPDLNLITRSQM